jgi:hypothetical protein
MNKKVLGFALTVFFLAMLVAPVLAFGPSKATNNKNLVHLQVDEETGSSQVWMWNQPTGDEEPLKPANGVFQEWIFNGETGFKFRLWRKDASRCKIGNAIEIPPETASIMMVMANRPRWCYLSQDAYYHFLSLMPGLDENVIAPYFPDGIYMRITFPGETP